MLRSSAIGQVRLQAAHVLHGLEALDADLLKTLFKDPDPRVRAGALILAEKRTEPEVIAAAMELSSDQNMKVLLQLALSCGEWTGGGIGATLASIAQQNPQDPMLRAAVMSSALRHAESFGAAILAGDRAAWMGYREPILRQSVAIGDFTMIASLIEHERQSAEKTGDVSGLDACLLDLQRIGFDVFGRSDQEGHPALNESSKRLAGWCDEVLASYRADSMHEDKEIAALVPLLRLARYRDEAAVALVEHLNPRVSNEVQAMILRAFSQSGSEIVLAKIVDALPQLTPGLAVAAIDVWLSREAWVADLLQRLERQELEARWLDPVQSARLSNHADPDMAQRFQKVIRSVQSGDREQILESYMAATREVGEIEKGKLVYQRACASCHRRGSDPGSEVGPNLASVTAHAKEKLLRNILIPSADIQPGYYAFTCRLDSGEVVSGVLASETSGSISIKQANGETRSIAREEMEMLRNTGRSLMPDGLESTISITDMRDLLEYLRQPL
jgi:putative heme-binding domain-containing protein